MSRPLLIVIACGSVAALLVALSFGRDAPANVPTPMSVVTTQAAVAPSVAPPPPSFSASAVQVRRAQLDLWQQRLVRAEDTLSKYKSSTRYPHEARPLAEHPDQLRPFDPVAEEMPLRTPGGQPAKGVHVRSTQDRVFASGAESVRVTVRAVDDDDRPLPLLVTRAMAFDLPDARRPAGRPQVPVSFTDAADGSLAAVLQPSTQGFPDFAGTIRIQAYLNQAGQLGNVNFDLVYNPLVPAEWAGVREALQAGSLDFFLKAKVAQPGRYVVSARVDDAAGKPFALLSFNDEVAVGEQEFRLRLFGKLVRDGKPAFPLALRDVQGFLLLPDRFPDRAMLPRQAGTVHTSQAYALDRFSDAEWSSEERSRYLAELNKDVDEARKQVDALTR
jgi:hypothetical protein